MLSFDLVLLQAYWTFDKFSVLCDESFQVCSGSLDHVGQRDRKDMSVLFKDIVLTHI